LDGGLVEESHGLMGCSLVRQEVAQLAPLGSGFGNVLGHRHGIAVIGRHPSAKVLEGVDMFQVGGSSTECGSLCLSRNYLLCEGAAHIAFASCHAELAELVFVMREGTLEAAVTAWGHNLFFSYFDLNVVVPKEEVPLDGIPSTLYGDAA